MLHIVHRPPAIKNFPLVVLLCLFATGIQFAVFKSLSLLETQTWVDYLSFGRWSLYVGMIPILLYFISPRNLFWGGLIFLISDLWFSVPFYRLELNKVILLLSFGKWLLLGLNLVLIRDESKEAFFNKNYSFFDIYPLPIQELNCLLLCKDQRYEGVLTNISEYSAFVRIKGELPTPFPDEVLVQLQFEGVNFQDRAKVMTVAKKEQGLGLLLGSGQTRKEEKRFGWEDFFKVCLDRGIVS